MINKTVIGYVPGSGGVKLRLLLPWQPQWLQSSALYAQYDLTNSITNAVTDDIKSRKNEILTNSLQTVSNSHAMVGHDAIQPPPLFPVLKDDTLVGLDGQIIEPFYQSNDIVMSHSMSYRVLKMQFPDRKIVKIKCDPMQALRRWWVVFAKDQNLQTPTIPAQFGQAVTKITNPNHKLIAHLIIMHLDYYNNHYDLNADVLVDIDKGAGEFCYFMKRDLDICQDPDFDLVSNLLKQHQSVQDILSNIASQSS